MATQRDKAGKFLKGHTPIPGAHRPKGTPNLVTKTLRQQIEGAFTAKGGVQAFVEYLIVEHPVVAAALLAKLLPPVEVEEALKNAGGRTIVHVHSIPTNHFVVNNQIISGNSENMEDGALSLEYRSLEEAAAPPIEIMPPEPVLVADEAPAAPEPEYESYQERMLRLAREAEARGECWIMRDPGVVHRFPKPRY
jgi:hypothetical protein